MGTFSSPSSGILCGGSGLTEKAWRLIHIYSLPLSLPRLEHFMRNTDMARSLLAPQFVPPVPHFAVLGTMCESLERGVGGEVGERHDFGAGGAGAGVGEGAAA